MGPEPIQHRDALGKLRLFSVDEIGDSEMVFGEMRPRIRYRLPGIHLTVWENLGKKTEPEQVTNELEKDYRVAIALPCLKKIERPSAISLSAQNKLGVAISKLFSWLSDEAHIYFLLTLILDYKDLANVRNKLSRRHRWRNRLLREVACDRTAHAVLRTTARPPLSVFIVQCRRCLLTVVHNDEKVEIVKMERPTPELNLSMDVKEKQREYTRHFTSTSYVLEYDKSKAHICSSMNFANFGKTRIDLQLDKQNALHINQHNALVKKNREILLHLINAVCFLGKQELAFRGHNESVESDTIGNYIEYLSSLSEFDHLLVNHLGSSTVFRGTSLAIQNYLIFAISGVMIKNIKPFVAIVDETSYCSNQSQFSTVLRYVDSTANV
ncbi:hypothetical protein ANN_21427 [Periplaneta americana]|uniref:DUF4371 domain-containing protein n=1 Tax=Periplaneta americana TaxID=6978 RepID=A0ABQ8SFQ3_PERAM|nr:hypothetical protein ANN_21427 [Periplaneta americana]